MWRPEKFVRGKNELSGLFATTQFYKCESYLTVKINFGPNPVNIRNRKKIRATDSSQLEPKLNEIMSKRTVLSLFFPFIYWHINCRWNSSAFTTNQMLFFLSVGTGKQLPPRAFNGQVNYWEEEKFQKTAPSALLLCTFLLVSWAKVPLLFCCFREENRGWESN